MRFFLWVECGCLCIGFTMSFVVVLVSLVVDDGSGMCGVMASDTWIRFCFVFVNFLIQLSFFR